VIHISLFSNSDALSEQVYILAIFLHLSIEKLHSKMNNNSFAIFSANPMHADNEDEQFSAGLAADGHDHNSSGANLLDGTVGATTSAAVTAIGMQKVDLFQMK
jgi:hypothetical protein